MKLPAVVLLTILFLPLTFISCKTGHKKNVDPIALRMDSTKDDNGPVDVNLSISEIIELDSSTVYRLAAIYKNKPVGFELEIPKNDNLNGKGFGNGIAINTIGKQSDDFINALSEIYGIKTPNKKFVNNIVVSYVDLHQFAKTLTDKGIENSPYSTELKLFFESDKGEEAELYLNISGDEKVMEFPEKDEEYRKLIISFLTQQ